MNKTPLQVNIVKNN